MNNADGYSGPNTQAAFGSLGYGSATEAYNALVGSAEKFTSSKAIVEASNTGSNVNDRILAIEAMYEAGNITAKQKKILIYALKNPSK